MAQKITYDWSKFTLKIPIKKSPARVFKAWTDDKQVSNWFTVKTILEPKTNGRIYFEWLAGDKLETKFISVIKNKKIVFPFGSHEEKVEVKFLKDGKNCICLLHQYDMKTSPKVKWNMHRGCITGWTFFLTNLKVYLENDIDLRSHDVKKSYKFGFINS